MTTKKITPIGSAVCPAVRNINKNECLVLLYRYISRRNTFIVHCKKVLTVHHQNIKI